MKLKNYLQEYGIRINFFAKRVGVSAPTLSTWIHEKHIPTVIYAYKIEQITEGKVKLQDWITEDIKKKIQSKNREKQQQEKPNESNDLEKFPEKLLS